MLGTNLMRKRNFSVLKLAFVLGSIIVGLILTQPAARADVRDSVVKIYSVQNRPDYDNPWNMEGPHSSSGSGCVIAGNRILTNAHVVSDQTFLQVRLHGGSKKFRARVKAVSHEADLALLTVDDKSFFEGLSPLELSDLPKVQDEVVVYGFPKGGDTLSTTKGVISRIEHHRYSHSLIELLAAQLDAAVNPGNSGGPVTVGGRVVGVVMQSLKYSENIGYMVPSPVINHFLIDVEDGRYDGFPVCGITYQTMENASIKRKFGLKDGQEGALVLSILSGSPAEGKLQPGDVITAIDGHPVADDCTVEFRPKERTSFIYYVQQRQVGEDLQLKILRSGNEKVIKITLDTTWGNLRLVPLKRHDVVPAYYVYGGLVFCPVTLNYLMTWGEDWKEDVPANLMNYLVNGKRSREDEEVVVIMKFLPSSANHGYERFTDKRIVEVNGKKIWNLRQLIQYVEDANDDPFVVFKTETNQVIVLDRSQVEKEQKEILETYRIPADRSPDLAATSKN